MKCNLPKSSNFKIQIAIDGESATGKSTLALQLAQKFSALGLKLNVVDTGQAYRALTLRALEQNMLSPQTGISPSSTNLLIELVVSGRLIFSPPSPHAFFCPIILDGVDVSPILSAKAAQIDAFVSTVAGCGVRPALIAMFQRVAAEFGSVIMVGRDIGERVLPAADLKFFLVADPLTRSRRRAAQRLQDPLLAHSDLVQRDSSDKAQSALLQPADAIIIDTAANDISQMTELAWRKVLDRLQ